eukprot:4977131-Pyramimonas_sp.AAC.1
MQEEFRRNVKRAIREGLEDKERLNTMLKQAEIAGIAKTDKAVKDVFDLLSAARVPESRVKIPKAVIELVALPETDAPAWRVLGSTYEVSKVVGEGAYGMVMKSFNRKTRQVVAIKEFKVRGPSKKHPRTTVTKGVRKSFNRKNKQVVTIIGVQGRRPLEKTPKNYGDEG